MRPINRSSSQALSPQKSCTSLAGPPPLHFVWGQPSAVCTPCCLQLLQALLQVYCQAHFLVFYQFLCRMSLCRVPGLQRKTRYSIHRITGGRSSKRYHKGVIFIGRYQSQLLMLTPLYTVLYVSECSMLRRHREKWSIKGASAQVHKTNFH